ncbi:hypothetical protein EDC01DRAFT_40417 [Geopyxis carbonaria]|nr:hypothetical protein EDC01DRAFT_40417 [Geopyxis carbonaria]
MGGDNFSVTFGAGLQILSVVPTDAANSPLSSSFTTNISQPPAPTSRAVITDTDCPVCLSPVAPADAIYTPCGHTYCHHCLHSYFSTALASRTFPLACIHAATTAAPWPCTAPYPLPFLRRLLASSLPAHLTAAFSAHIQTRPQTYIPCPTPDCPTVHASAAATCRRCLVPAPPATAAFNSWCVDERVQPCPGCAAPIQLAEGCPHVHCPVCRTHMCFACQPPARFDVAADVYTHVREVHPDPPDERERREAEHRRNEELTAEFYRREGRV